MLLILRNESLGTGLSSREPKAYGRTMLTVWEPKWCAVGLDCKHNLRRAMGPRTDVYGIKRQSYISFLSFFLPFFSFKIYLFYTWVVYLHICVLGTCRIQMWASSPLDLEFGMVVNHHESSARTSILDW